jgi:hypothetical protein
LAIADPFIDAFRIGVQRFGLATPDALIGDKDSAAQHYGQAREYGRKQEKCVTAHRNLRRLDRALASSRIVLLASWSTTTCKSPADRYNSWG